MEPKYMLRNFCSWTNLQTLHLCFHLWINHIFIPRKVERQAYKAFHSDKAVHLQQACCSYESSVIWLTILKKQQIQTYLKPHYLSHLLETSWKPHSFRHSETEQSVTFWQPWGTCTLEKLGKLWIYLHISVILPWIGEEPCYHLTFFRKVFALSDPTPISRNELIAVTNQLYKCVIVSTFISM